MNLNMDGAEMHHFCERGMSHSLVVYVLQLHIYPHYIYTHSHIYNVRIDIWCINVSLLFNMDNPFCESIKVHPQIYHSGG